MDNQSNPFTRGVQDFFGGLGSGFGGGDGEPSNRNPPRGGATAGNQFESFIGSIFGNAEQQFEAATQAAMAASMREQQAQQQGPPPTSPNALKNLPLVKIEGEDLIDPVNRECSICLERHDIGDTAVRLPCAHIFHSPCITEWLEQHCTCPVCRYELPSLNDEFERGRKERMRNRRPRYAKHELERLTIRELKALLLPNNRYQPLDRTDLINHLISSGAIDFVASPEPVCYSLSALRQMKASRLKKCMNEEAGVFFDPKSVLEKEDMIQIFVNSGRLDILPEDDENDVAMNESFHTMNGPSSDVAQSDTASPVDGLLVETVDEGVQPTEDLRVDTTIIMEESQPPLSQINCNDADMAAAHSEMQNTRVLECQEQSYATNESEHGLNPIGTEGEPSRDTLPASESLSEINSDSSSDQLTRHEESLSSSIAPTTPAENTFGSERSSSSESTMSGKKRPLSRNDSTGMVSSQLDEMSISELRRTGQQLKVDLSNCLERSEMMERLETATEQANTTDASNSALPYLVDLSASDLRLLISSVGATSPVNGGEPEDLIRLLSTEMQQRPYAKGLIEALIPFLSLSISQLRSVARQRGVDLSDCIEKSEILGRLVRWSST